MEENFFFERLFVCDIVRPYKEIPVKSWQLKHKKRTRCEKCSRLRMKTLKRSQWHRSSVFIVNYEHISNFLLVIDFEQAKVSWVHIKKVNTFENKIRLSFVNKYHLKLYYHNPMGESG